MATLIYGFTSLNVADGNSLKEINGALLNDADMALGIYNSQKCFYQLDESSGATESLPDIVSPSLNAGTKRWILKAYLVADITANGLTASKPVFTDANKKLVSTGTLGVDQGGTGASTLTDHGILLGSGTDPVTPMTALGAGELVVGVAGADPHALAAGATTKILVGGGAADPVWTEATGTGAPVRATSPTLVTPALGTPASGDLQNCTAATATAKGVVELDTDAEAVTGEDTERALTAANLKAVLGHDYTYPIQEIVEYSEAQ